MKRMLLFALTLIIVSSPFMIPRDCSAKTVKFSKPGFYETDGSPHSIYTPLNVKGKTLNVVDFGADPSNSTKDDCKAIQTALGKAQAGDEVYFPKGVYNFSSAPNQKDSTFLLLKTGVNLRGESESGTILYYDCKNPSKSLTRMLQGYGVHDIVISNLSIRSNFTGKYPVDPVRNNPDAAAFSYAIEIRDGDKSMGSYRVTIDHITVESYRKSGICIIGSHDIAVRNSTFKNAVDIGDGEGFGVCIQGKKHGLDRLGYANDCYFNLVENCRFTGPYLRHGVLLQFYAHNNLIRNNIFEKIALDAIDLHGEDEYLNEVYSNKISNLPAASAIGVGNGGAEHDKSGPGNYMHNNTITNALFGITVCYGSPGTIIEENTITKCTFKGGIGIKILNGPGTVVKGNKINYNNSPGFWGIVLSHDGGTTGERSGIGKGDPKNVILSGNSVCQNTNGIKIEAGNGIIEENNTVTNNTYINK